MNDIRDVRRLFDIREVLGRAGVTVGKRRWMNCPLPMHVHAHNTPSFSIFRGSDGVERFRCHGNCGAQGDVIDLAGYLWVNGYDPRQPGMVARALEALQLRHDPVFSMPETPRPTIRNNILGRYPLKSDGRAYAHDRGLTDKTIAKFKLGQDRFHLCIPTFVEGRLMSVKKRSINGGLRYLCESGSRLALFNHDEVAYKTGPIFYAKGEIPCMLLDQMGFRACATNMGEGAFDPNWTMLLALANVIVIGDNDLEGKRLAIERAQDLSALLRFPPGEYKDVDEWILAEPEARQTLEEWAR